MKFNINNKNNQGMITLIEAVAIVCVFGLASIMAVTYFGNKAAEARADARASDLKATVTKAPARPAVKKTETVVIQERVDAKVAELQALTEATVADPDDAKKAAVLTKEINELKKLQAAATPGPSGTQK